MLYTVDRCKILVELVNILQRIQFCAYSKCCEANKLVAVFLNYWANMFEMFQKDKLKIRCEKQPMKHRCHCFSSVSIFILLCNLSRMLFPPSYMTGNSFGWFSSDRCLQM